MSLFEAARWAPSSYNNQPWRFIYAKRNTSHWDKLFNLLVVQQQQQTQSFDKLQSKPFWIWSIEEHKLEDIMTFLTIFLESNPYSLALSRRFKSLLMCWVEIPCLSSSSFSCRYSLIASMFAFLFCSISLACLIS
jgi:hypothetical protein